VHSLAKFLIDFINRCLRSSYNNLIKINLLSLIIILGCSDFIIFYRGDVKVISVITERNIGFFSDNRSSINIGHKWFTILTLRLRGILTSYKDHIPYTSTPDTKIRISRHPLLLTSWWNFTRNMRIRKITSTSITSFISIIIFE